MAPRRILLDLASQNGEHKDLDRRSRRVPERTGDSVRVSNLTKSIFCITSSKTSLTVLDCNSVAAQVHAETIPEAMRPGLTDLDAVLNSSDCFVEYAV